MAEEKIEEEKLTGIKPVILVPRETNDPLVRELVLTDGNKVIRGDFGTEILFDDVAITIKRLSPFFSRRFEHHYMLDDAYEHDDCILTDDYEAPLILGEEEERDCWSSTFFIRVQKLNAPVQKCCGPSTVAKFLEDESTIEMILKNKDGTFLFRKVKVRVQIRPREGNSPALKIKCDQSYVNLDENGKWRSWIQAESRQDSSYVYSFDVTRYNHSIKGRLLLGRGNFVHNNLKEVYRGVLVDDQQPQQQPQPQRQQHKVVLKIIAAKYTPAEDKLELHNVGRDNLWAEVQTMIKINKLYPHLAVDVKGIYTTVSDKQRTGHLLVAFPYQSNSSLSLFLDSKKFTSSGSEQQMKMIRFFDKDITMGLQQLHELGYAHLDLTLENIVVTADYRCMLIDFGQARNINENLKVNLTELGCKKQYYNPFHLRWFGDTRDIKEDVILSPEMLKMIDNWNLGIIVMTLQGIINLGVPDWMKRIASFRNPVLDASLEEDIRAILLWVANSERILKFKLEWDYANYEGLELAIALLELAKCSDNSENLERAKTELERNHTRLSNRCEDDLEMAVASFKLAKDKPENLELAVTFLERAKCSKFDALNLAVTSLEWKFAKRSDKGWEMAAALLKSKCAELSVKFDSLELVVALLELANCFDWCEGLEEAVALLQQERAKRSADCDKCEGLELAMQLLCHNLYFSILSEESTKEDITKKLLKLSEAVQNHPWLRSLNDEERPTTFAQWTAASSDEKSTGKRSRSTQGVTSRESETSTNVTQQNEKKQQNELT
eukprot:gene6831-7546_t